MWPAFRSDGKAVTVDDCARMSHRELYRLLKENLPGLAETVREVNDVNREDILALLRYFSEEKDNGTREPS